MNLPKLRVVPAEHGQISLGSLWTVSGRDLPPSYVFILNPVNDFAFYTISAYDTISFRAFQSVGFAVFKPSTKPSGSKYLIIIDLPKTKIVITLAQNPST